jgi:glycyl-tRNA synthetase alpha subunit
MKNSSFQTIILKLQDFWASHGCLITQPYYSAWMIWLEKYSFLIRSSKRMALLSRLRIDYTAHPYFKMAA